MRLVIISIALSSLLVSCRSSRHTVEQHYETDAVYTTENMKTDNRTDLSLQWLRASDVELSDVSITYGNYCDSETCRTPIINAIHIGNVSIHRKDSVGVLSYNQVSVTDSVTSTRNTESFASHNSKNTVKCLTPADWVIMLVLTIALLWYIYVDWRRKY